MLLGLQPQRIAGATGRLDLPHQRAKHDERLLDLPELGLRLGTTDLRGHFQLDQDATARRLLEAALPHAQANFGEASRLSRLIRNDLANVAGDQGRFDEALAQYDKLIESWQQELGADTYRRHFERFSIEFNVAATLNQAQRWSESSARLRPVLDDARELFGDMDARSLGMSLVLAEALMHTGDSVSEAAELLDRMIAQLSGAPDRAAQTTLERARALRAQLAG